MKNKLLAIVLIMLTGMLTRAQISGTYDIPGTTYPTVASAIAALNVAGVGSGGVTFNIAAGYTETFTSTTAGLITMGNGTAANPIVFQKSGTGANPVITAATPGTTTYDGIIILSSATYVTFSGIDLLENPANVTLGTANALTEFGYALLKNSADAGSQHNTIQNCAISLHHFQNTLNFQAYAVFLRHRTPAWVSALPTTTAGSHSYNTISGLTVSNCMAGIYLFGYAPTTPPYALYDQYNTVTGNTVTLTGSSTAATYCYGVYVSGNTNLTVTNNAINGNVSFGGATGIALNSPAISVECSYNTFTLNYTGANSVNGFTSRLVDEGTANVTNYHHNTVQNVTMPTGQAFYPMQFGVGALFNVYDNVVTDVTIGNAGANSSTSIYGFAVFRNSFAGYSTTMNVYNNQFKNVNVLSLTPQGTVYQLFQFYDYNTAGDPAGPATNVYNNIVENVSIATTGTVDGILGYNNSALNILDNRISAIDSKGQINGLRLAGKKSNAAFKVYNNKIYGLTSNGTNASARAVGICDYDAGSSAGTAYYYNNFISDLKAPQSVSTDAVVGFYFAQANTSSYLFNNYLYNNTVYLDADFTSVVGPSGSSGVYSASLKKLEMKNNIIVNMSRQVGLGKTAALKFLGTLTAINYTQASNNNLLYADTPGPDNLIFADDVNSDQSLESFLARVFPRDASSVTEIPPFVNVTTTPYDLHLLTTEATQCESGGLVLTTPVAVSTDFDLDPRYPNAGYPDNPLSPATAPDLGADEFGGLFQDKKAPVVTFTVLKNTSLLTEFTLTTTITDKTGVPTSGIGLPRLYWKINASGSWNTSVATWVSGTTYTFTLNSGVALNDSVYYYFATQDTHSPINAGSTPANGSGYTINPPACSTPPPNSSCFSYKIVPGLCGTYTVGSGGDYPTITAAVAAISGKHIACPVVFQLTDATYTETLPINVGNYEYEGASAVNTITVRPAPGVDATISGTSTTAVFKLTRTSYFIFDGSNNGSSTRNLTIQNTATTGTRAVIWVASTGIADGTYGNVIKNCNIKNGSNTLTAYGIFVGSGTTIGTAGYDNENLTIDNNALSLAYIAISVNNASTGISDNLVINNNTIGSGDPASYISTKGIVIEGTNGAQVTGNEIYNITGTNVQMIGIDLKGSLSNTLVRDNKIHDFSCTAGSAGGAAGINIGVLPPNNTVSNTTIVNNLIYNLTTSNYNATHTTYNPFGIRICGGYNAILYHNTVRMTGTQASYGPNTAGSLSAALAVMGYGRVTQMKDNILTNDIVGLAGSRSFCIYMDKFDTYFSNSDYNDLWYSGPYGLCGMYSPGPNVEILCPTLADWQATTATYQIPCDVHSVSADPLYTSATNLMPTNYAIGKKGTQVTGVTTDFAQVIRTNPPDIGAYEFGVAATTEAATGITTGGATLNGSVLSNVVAVTTFFDYGTTTAYGQTVAATPGTVSPGTAAQNFSAAVTGLLPLTTYHFRARVVTPGSAEITGPDSTFTTSLPENTAVQNVTIVNGQDTCFNATNTITVAGGGTTFVVQNGGSATMIAGEKILYLPGTVVVAGGYMLGYITQNGQYCGIQPSAPMVAASVPGTDPLVSEKPAFRIYPNPTTGSFTLEMTGDGQLQGSVAQICDIRGNKVLDIDLNGVNRQVISLEDQPRGMYFIRVINGQGSETGKVIKQ